MVINSFSIEESANSNSRNHVDDGPTPSNRLMAIKKEENTLHQNISPMITKDKVRRIERMDDLFKTSGVFSHKKPKHQKKQSKFWGAKELMALMESRTPKNWDDN